MKCPFCNNSDKVKLSQTPWNGKFWCNGCKDWFNDCCSMEDKPAKLADATLDEIEQGQGYPPFPAGLFARNRATPPPVVDTDEAFRAEFAKRFPSINYNFIVTMQEVGDLGNAKYKENSVEGRIARGDMTRFTERIYAREIIRHSCQHGNEYLDGIKHDVYKTRRHQLGAAAFNPMMEFSLAELENEPSAPLEIINR